MLPPLGGGVRARQRTFPVARSWPLDTAAGGHKLCMSTSLPSRKQSRTDSTDFHFEIAPILPSAPPPPARALQSSSLTCDMLETPLMRKTANSRDSALFALFQSSPSGRQYLCLSLGLGLVVCARSVELCELEVERHRELGEERRERSEEMGNGRGSVADSRCWGREG